MALSRRWSTIILAVAGMVFLGRWAGAGETLSYQGQVPAEAFGRLTQAAQDSTGNALAPWQRDLMLQIAGAKPQGASAEPAAIAGTPSVDGVWSMLPASGRYYHSAIYDPVRARMVIFGGWDGTYRNDVWALSLSGTPTWTQIVPAGTAPSPRYAHSAIYDPVRDRMVVFGGYTGTGYLNDVWALSFSGTPAWTALAPGGSLPAGRLGHTAVYDPVRDRMVVFAGTNGGTLNDTWALSFGGTPSWSAIIASTPPAKRVFQAGIYDPLRDRLVIFGGTTGISYLGDTWTLPFTGTPAWSQLSLTGAPSPRLAHTAVYDGLRDRMVVFAGYGGAFLNDSYALSFGVGSWSLIGGGSPPAARDLHSAIYDPVHDRMVVFGGNDGSNYLGDLWTLSFPGTPQWSAFGGTPSARELHSAIYDPLRKRMIVFGGYAGSGNNETWQLSLDATPTWTPVTPTGTSPSPRWGHSAIYDPVRDRMLVFGGHTPDPVNEVWALSLGGTPAWTLLATNGAPPTARYVQSAIYDPVNDRMIVFGGNDGSPRNDTWQLALAGTPTWALIAAGGALPSPRYLQSAIYDPPRGRMVVFGGYDGNYLNDVWALSLGASPAWTALSPGGTLPPPRLAHSAIEDPVRDRMVIFGGYGVSYDGDTWALSLSTPSWTQLAPTGSLPAARELHTSIYDVVNDQMVIFAGHSGPYRNDTFFLLWGTPSPPPPPPPSEIVFDLSPNPLNLRSRGLWVKATLTPPSPFTPGDIDLASLRLNGTVTVDPAAPVTLEATDLQVRFDRSELEATVKDGDAVPVTITGTMGGTAFSSTITIRVHRAIVKAPVAGLQLEGGSVTNVDWIMAASDTTASATADSLAADSTRAVAVLYSVDGGDSWDLVSAAEPNTGTYGWTVPNVSTTQARVAVVLVQSADSTGTVVSGIVGVSGVFSIDAVVGVGGPGTARPVLRAAPNPSLDGRLRVEFALRDASAARLELMDLAGRVLDTRQVGALGAGRHSLELTRGTPLPCGIYFLRLVRRGEEVRARAAVIR